MLAKGNTCNLLRDIYISYICVRDMCEILILILIWYYRVLFREFFKFSLQCVFIWKIFDVKYLLKYCILNSILFVSDKIQLSDIVEIEFRYNTQ